MRYRIAPLMLQVIAVSLVLVAISPAPALGQSLPPPPRAIPEDASLELHLELIINQRSTGRIVPVTRQSGAFLLRRQDLLEAGLAAEHLGEDLLINLSRLDSLVVNYHSAGQQLYLEVPTHWLPRQRLDGERASQYSTARSSPGALLNYDTFVRHQRHGATTASLDHEIRLFGKTGTLSSSGIYRQVLTGHSGTAEGYRRFNTRWEVSDQERLMTYAVGDVVTRPLGWSSAVRLGGIQLSRDFALRPDLVTYPLPDFSGEVDVPSTLDLFIDGARRSSLELEPGPFTLTNMPMVTGAGEATLVTVDAQGRRVESRLPFYVSSELLRPGWSSYNINAGALRRHFGQRDFSYGAAAATGDRKSVV